MNGLRPIVEFMTWNFAILAFDQIVNNAAKTLSQSAGRFSALSCFGVQVVRQDNWHNNILRLLSPGWQMYPD